jgi:hypothetical protein
VVCNEIDIGGSGGYCGGRNVHLDRAKMFYHRALGSKYFPRAVLFNLENGVIGSAT